MTDQELETDYLVIGAGAGAMAFTDALLAHSDATVTIVDRRHAPGGHWLNAYPFVRLHQPSAFYGVSSVPLGDDSIDVTGTNAGYYELSGADELRAYFARVMHRHFLPTGRVRYFPMSEYVGEHRFVSTLTEKSWRVRVRRKLVDTTYVEGSIPATSPPPFEVADGVRCLPAGQIAYLGERPERFVIVGAGKTALDACVWLLEQRVDPSTIRWIKPRDSWWANRRFRQPHTMLPEFYRGIALQLEAMARASSVEELLTSLEAEGYFLRINPEIVPTMWRGASLGESEVTLLRQIEDVIRMGHVQRIERDEIILDQGRIKTSPQTVHIHCAARGLRRLPPRPIFEPGRVTIQPFLLGFVCYQFAMLGVVEATIASDDEKNRLCPAISYWNVNRDYLSAFLATLTHDRARKAYPTVADWAKTTRLNPLAGLAHHREDPKVTESAERIARAGQTVADNLKRLIDSE